MRFTRQNLFSITLSGVIQLFSLLPPQSNFTLQSHRACILSMCSHNICVNQVADTYSDSNIFSWGTINKGSHYKVDGSTKDMWKSCCELLVPPPPSSLVCSWFTGWALSASLLGLHLITSNCWWCYLILSICSTDYSLSLFGSLH